MELQLLDHLHWHDVKKQFNQHFPFLKLECFSQAHAESTGTAKKAMLDGNTPLNTLNLKQYGTFTFSESNSVNAFEQSLAKDFGLHVHVFRHSGNVFIETTATDDWTLMAQNNEAKASSEQHSTEHQDLTDRDQWD
jgi:DNA-binding FadR family transcriptional regulator